jgi:Leucine-rich repeat (LRR) protein
VIDPAMKESITALHKKLLVAYTKENLHRITSKIILLHRNKQEYALRRILSLVSEKTGSGNPDKAFYALMMLYHPDRIDHHRTEIDRLLSLKDSAGLNYYSHIFAMLELEPQLTITPTSIEAAATAYEYEWEEPDTAMEDGREMGDTDDFVFESADLPSGMDFYSVFKRSIYRHDNVELPFYYLEELDSLELNGYGIESLDGIRHCIRVTVLDLSRNRIDNIAELEYLTMLQEVFLSENRIGYIDALSFAVNLRVVDLAGNRVDDISPLLTLEHLEYVNIIGNPVPAQQVSILRKRGIVVLS